jgi:hypothetical protein
MEFAFSANEIVDFDNGALVGRGRIVGCAVTFQVDGNAYMVKVIDGCLPTEEYPFDTLAIAEPHLKKVEPEWGITFVVRGNWLGREVACRIMQCLGKGGPHAWEDGDQGEPFWREDEEKWEFGGNSYWLRKLGETPPDKISRTHGLRCPVQTFRLDYRYTTPDRREALHCLVKWLESDLMLGKMCPRAPEE